MSSATMNAMEVDTASLELIKQAVPVKTLIISTIVDDNNIKKLTVIKLYNKVRQNGSI